jgi:hypothetical protein
VVKSFDSLDVVASLTEWNYSKQFVTSQKAGGY